MDFWIFLHIFQEHFVHSLLVYDLIGSVRDENNSGVEFDNSSIVEFRSTVEFKKPYHCRIRKHFRQRFTERCRIRQRFYYWKKNQKRRQSKICKICVRKDLQNFRKKKSLEINISSLEKDKHKPFFFTSIENLFICLLKKN